MLTYLITSTHIARTPSKHTARTLEEVFGYQRCTKEQYLQRMREIRALDTPADQAEKERTASDPNQETTQ